jgi:hypothetical protein
MKELPAEEFHALPSPRHRMPTPMALVMQNNVVFQIESAPADGIRLPSLRNGDIGTSPFFFTAP